jgi:hypothetical protein
MMTDRIVESMPQLLRAVSDSSVTRIRLDLPLLALTEQRAWEQQINQHLDECGCREGELGLITGLAGAAAIIYDLAEVARPTRWLCAGALCRANRSGKRKIGRPTTRPSPRQESRRESIAQLSLNDFPIELRRHSPTLGSVRGVRSTTTVAVKP